MLPSVRPNKNPPTCPATTPRVVWRTISGARGIASRLKGHKRHWYRSARQRWRAQRSIKMASSAAIVSVAILYKIWQPPKSLPMADKESKQTPGQPNRSTEKHKIGEFGSLTGRAAPRGIRHLELPRSASGAKPKHSNTLCGQKPAPTNINKGPKQTPVPRNKIWGQNARGHTLREGKCELANKRTPLNSQRRLLCC